MRAQAPPVYEALIGERDRYMAHALRDCEGSSVVGVVGLAHLDGIVQTLMREEGARARLCAARGQEQPGSSRRMRPREPSGSLRGRRQEAEIHSRAIVLEWLVLAPRGRLLGNRVACQRFSFVRSL